MQFFNEIEPFAVGWLRTMYGDSQVDTRSITQVVPADVAGFRRVHFFAGIGGWELALQIAGWPEEREIWTGSCPCQPFSVAGKRGGTDDERHLWPEMFRLIRECHPATAMGEQVSSKDGLLWLDGVFDDLEAEGYTCWAVDTCAASVSAPHIRQRLYWVAYASKPERGRRPIPKGRRKRIQHAANGDTIDGLANATEARHARAGSGTTADRDGENPLPQRRVAQRESAGSGETRRLADAASPSGPQQLGEQRIGLWREAAAEDATKRRELAHWLEHAPSDGRERGMGDTKHSRPQIGHPSGGMVEGETGATTIEAGPWSNAAIIRCRDGKSRTISPKPGDEPLAYGIPVKAGHLVARLGELGFDSKNAKRIIANARRNRTGRLRGYGNAIVPQVAVEFIRSILECET